MKTEFSNAEKVSNFYLQTQFDKVKQKLERYEGLVTWEIAKEYLTRLSTIHEEELDNYEKLKQFIHLEREWNEYIHSKQVLFDGIIFLASYASKEIQYLNLLTWAFELIQSITSKTPYIHIGDISHVLYPEEEKLSLEWILDQFTSEDILHLKDVIREYYEKIFLIIVNRKESIKGVNSMNLANLVEASASNEEHYQIVKDSFRKSYEKLYFETVSSCIAKSFFLAIQEAIHEDDTLLHKESFWDILLYVIEEKDNLDKIFVQSDEEEMEMLMEADRLPTLKKVTQEELPSILAEPVLMNLDLREVNLSSYTNLNVFYMKNCNVKGNHTARIFFSSEVKKIYYVRGVPMNFYDLTNSCFQGCRIMGLKSLFPFTFSGQTFDEEVIQKHGMYLSNVSDTIREKYYRGIPLTKKEIVEVLQHNPSSMLMSRYQEIHQNINLLLLFQLNDLIPGIVQKIMTKQGGED